MRPENAVEWLQMMPDLLTRTGWTQACARPSARLMHRACPWGGHLIKFESTVSSGSYLVRPEVRSSLMNKSAQGMRCELEEFIAPGEAILRCSTSWYPTRFFDALFGRHEGVDNQVFASDDFSETHRHTSLRDFPCPGDSAWTMAQTHGTQRGRFALLRPDQDADKCRLYVVLVICEDAFADWATFQFVTLLDTLKVAFERFVARLSTKEALEMDEQLYVTLTISDLKRGNPFLPAEGTTSLCVDSGAALGLLHWERFQGEFCLAEYLKVFMTRLGEEISTFESLDSRRLCPHQCVVRGDQWRRVRQRFFEALRVQRAAYRRGNGGPDAPTVREGAAPRFVGQPCFQKKPPSRGPGFPQGAQLVVRNTFWDILEPRRASRRSRTVSLPLRMPEQ
ncbi:unnamed protein product [Effrenium voratum]|nr:unnamed protein product [Effrenium voratum]|mmetsp:Transcript_12072/g.28610  ORF Transcript_12072/g.28610 Transcript_12072/m.28610 type:complete len:394 (-) Transcript_12072:263-1444(-)